MRTWDVVAALLAMLTNCVFGAETVSRIVGSFDWCAWNPTWSKAPGQVSITDERSPDLTNGKSMRIEVHFSGKGFEWFSVCLLYTSDAADE